MGPAVLWGEGVAASAAALTGLSSVGSGVGTAVTAGVIGGASAFAGGVACAIGSGADYYDCANVAAAGSALHGGSYLAGEGINLLRQIQNMRGSNPGFGKYSGPTSGYNNKKPDDLNIELGLQNRKTIDELYSTNDFDRTSNLLGAPQELRGTNKYIYAIDETGEIWISRAGATHHADLVGGKNVYGAGEMYIDRSGQIRLINDGSGHYLPQGSEFFPYLKSLLNSKGIDANQTILDNYGG